MNTQHAKVGDVVRYVETPASFDMTTGKLYYICDETDSRLDGMFGRCFYDDKGNRRAFWKPSDYEIVGELQNMEPAQAVLEDVMGRNLFVGDTIVYPVSVDRMEILRIESICRKTLTAVCSYVGSSERLAVHGTVTVGCTNQRAVKVASATNAH